MKPADKLRIIVERLAIGAGVALAVGAATAWWQWADRFRTTVVRGVQAGTPAWGYVVSGIALLGTVFAAIVIYEARTSRWPSSPQKIPRWAVVVVTAAPVFALIIIAVTSFALSQWEYHSRHNLMDAVTLRERRGEPAGYEPRMSYPEARALLGRTLGDVQADTVWNIQRIPESTSWCGVLVVNSWRRPAQGVACVSDARKVTVRPFAGEVPSPKAMYRLSLHRRVAKSAPGTTYSDADPYGYIRNGRAVLVVPVKAYVRYPHVYDVPRGVVVWDATRRGTHLANVSRGELWGPVIGVSTAESIRTALGARGSFPSYRDARARLVPSNVRGTRRDTLNPNVGRTSEFLLRRVDGATAYVSPLTRAGTSTSVIAVLEVETGVVRSGKMPRATLWRVPARRSIAEGARIVLARYSKDMLGMSVLEIAPTGSGTWRASIGTPLAVAYRVEIGGDLSTCVSDAGSGAEIRCDRGDNPRPVNQGALSWSGGDDATGAPTDERLDTLSVDELIARRDAVQAEIDRRARG